MVINNYSFFHRAMLQHNCMLYLCGHISTPISGRYSHLVGELGDCEVQVVLIQSPLSILLPGPIQYNGFYLHLKIVCCGLRVCIISSCVLRCRRPNTLQGHNCGHMMASSFAIVSPCFDDFKTPSCLEGYSI